MQSQQFRYANRPHSKRICPKFKDTLFKNHTNFTKSLLFCKSLKLSKVTTSEVDTIDNLVTIESMVTRWSIVTTSEVNGIDLSHPR